jgi:hypothetical protein
MMRPVCRVLERAPADALEVADLLGLGTTQPIQCLVGQRHHVERIHSGLGIQRVLARAGMKRGTHAQADVGDRLGIAAVHRQVGREGLERGGIPARGVEQQAANIQVLDAFTLSH